MRWKIERIGKTIKDVLALPDRLHSLPPVCSTSAAQQHTHSFFMDGLNFEYLSWKKATNVETHPLPSSFLSGELKQVPGYFWGKLGGVRKDQGFVQVWLRIGNREMQ